MRAIKLIIHIDGSATANALHIVLADLKVLQKDIAVFGRPFPLNIVWPIIFILVGERNNHTQFFIKKMIAIGERTINGWSVPDHIIAATHVDG